jgi:hypothetical protein
MRLERPCKPNSNSSRPPRLFPGGSRALQRPLAAAAAAAAKGQRGDRSRDGDDSKHEQTTLELDGPGHARGSTRVFGACAA